MPRPNAPSLVTEADRSPSAAARVGGFALPLLALLLATCESAFLAVAQRVADAAGAGVPMP